jgi:hypothetical protein
LLAAHSGEREKEERSRKILELKELEVRGLLRILNSKELRDIYRSVGIFRMEIWL